MTVPLRPPALTSTAAAVAGCALPGCCIPGCTATWNLCATRTPSTRPRCPPLCTLPRSFPTLASLPSARTGFGAGLRTAGLHDAPKREGSACYRVTTVNEITSSHVIHDGRARVINLEDGRLRVINLEHGRTHDPGTIGRHCQRIHHYGGSVHKEDRLPGSSASSRRGVQLVAAEPLHCHKQ